MKIVIKVDPDDNANMIDLVFTDEELDNDNFIELVAEDHCYMVSVDDLYSAAKTFKDKRELRLQTEALLKEDE